MARDAIEVEEFHKAYGSVEAVKGVSLSVRAGELFGLIGPDGAGKTTLMRTVCTLLAPDSGTVRVLGLDAVRDQTEIRARVGYMPQRFSLYQDLSVAQNLRFFADLFGVPRSERETRSERLYTFSRLGPFKSRKAGALSGGMKQKLALSCALIHTPEVLVLDEPTFGVDPVSRQEFWEILGNLREEGTTILVSTAYMDEADGCDRVGLMHRGRVRALDTPAALRAAYPYPLYRVVGDEVHALRDFFAGLAGVHTTQLFGDAVHVSFDRPPEASSWAEWRDRAPGGLRRWGEVTPSIEDVFMEAIGEA